MNQATKKINSREEAPIIEIRNNDVVFTMSYEGVYDYFIEMINVKDNFKGNISLKIKKGEDHYASFDNLYEGIKAVEMEYYSKPFENEKVVWKCDDYPENKGDIFKISKGNGSIFLEMIPHYYGSIFGTVRIRTSGSRYGDYFKYFSNLYRELSHLDVEKENNKVLKLKK